MCGQTHRQTQGETVAELHPHSILNYFNGMLLLVFLWPIIFICPVHSLFGISQDSPV